MLEFFQTKGNNFWLESNLGNEQILGPITILDKSALQSLSAAEIRFFNRYYKLNIAPVLGIEILGDLKKAALHPLQGESIAQGLATKLGRCDSHVNLHFKSAIVSELLGEKIEMDGRILMPRGTLKKGRLGERGVIFEESPEEIAINNWRRGIFTDTDQSLAKRWRDATRLINLEPIKKDLKSRLPKAHRIDTLIDVVDVIDNSLSDESMQRQYLEYALVEFGVDQSISSEALIRWETSHFQSLFEFAPYLHFCIRATNTFYLALAVDLVTPRPTNRIDLEYLYYLPFCFVFASRDRFHSDMVPLFLRPDQTYVDGDLLKEDLKRISNEWEELTESQKQIWKNTNKMYPPSRDDSITYQLWKKYMKDEETLRKEEPHEGVSESAALKFLEKVKGTLSRAEEKESFSKESIDLDQLDFVATKRTIFPDDPCPCGSGISFGECHYKILKKD